MPNTRSNLNPQDWSDEDFCNASGSADYSNARRKTTPHRHPSRAKRKRSSLGTNRTAETCLTPVANHASAVVSRHEPRESTEAKRNPSAKIARRTTELHRVNENSKIRTPKTLRDYFQPASTTFVSPTPDTASFSRHTSFNTRDNPEPRIGTIQPLVVHGSSPGRTNESKNLENFEVDEPQGTLEIAEESQFVEESSRSEFQHAPVRQLEDSESSSDYKLNQYPFDIKSGSEQASSCPVCGISMSEMALSNRVSHVNQCLDGPSEENSGDKATIDGTPPIPARSFPMQEGTVFQKFCNAFSFGKRSVDLQFEASTPNENVSLGKAQSGSGKPPNEAKGSLLKKGSSRTCPWYKRMPGTSFVVDAFSFGDIPPPPSSDTATSYFLSHYHSDHYGGLTSSFSRGLIYCSSITGNLIVQQLKVKEEFVRRMPMNEQVMVDGVGVTLLDANHCPGSVLFLFCIPKKDGSVLRLLHTGDFRAHASMTTHPAIVQPQNPPIDILYLDTTYCDPKYCFPPQLQVVEAAVDLCQALYLGKVADPRIDLSREKATMNAWLSKRDIQLGDEKAQKITETHWRSDKSNLEQEGRASTARRILFVIGSYTIGKERVFMAIAKAIGSKVYVPEWKREVFACLENEEANAMLTTDPKLAMVHIVPLRDINPQGMTEYLSKCQAFCSEIHAFRPTGWTFSTTKVPPTSKYTASSIRSTTRSPPITIYGLPYSEHSSFRELASFSMSLDIRKIIPTVNIGSAMSRQKMQIHFDAWNAEKSRKGGRIAWIGDGA